METLFAVLMALCLGVIFGLVIGTRLVMPDLMRLERNERVLRGMLEERGVRYLEDEQGRPME